MYLKYLCLKVKETLNNVSEYHFEHATSEDDISQYCINTGDARYSLPCIDGDKSRVL